MSSSSRSDGRAPDQLRTISFEANIAPHATGSVLVLMGVALVLANTGTLVQTADEGDKRLVSTLPLLHIAVVSTAALLPNLAAVVSRVDPRKSSYISFITGPSRTADIERVLTIGVHGPERLIIVLVDDLEVAA